MGFLTFLGVVFICFIAIWLPRFILAIVGGIALSFNLGIIITLAIIGFIVDLNLWFSRSTS